MRGFSEPLRYGHAVGRIRVVEAGLLSPHRLVRLMEADFEEALRILEEVDVGSYLAGARTAAEVDAGLLRYLKDVYRYLGEILPRGSYLLDYFLCKYDFHNLKVLLKAEMGGGEKGLLPGVGRIEVEVLRRGLAQPSLLPSPYRELVEEAAGKGFSPEDLEAICDRYFLQHRLQLARMEGNALLIKFSTLSIDLANLKALVRAKFVNKDPSFLQGVLVEGGEIKPAELLRLYPEPWETMVKRLESMPYSRELLRLLESYEDRKRLTDFDRRADDLLMELAARARRISVGVEPIFAYVRARENEVTVLRVLLMGKLHNLSPEEIEKVLRRLYTEELEGRL
jgi:V/A-type H+-transporting ATPase subunit C